MIQLAILSFQCPGMTHIHIPTRTSQGCTRVLVVENQSPLIEIYKNNIFFAISKMIIFYGFFSAFQSLYPKKNIFSAFQILSRAQPSFCYFMVSDPGVIWVQLSKLLFDVFFLNFICNTFCGSNFSSKLQLPKMPGKL